MKLTATQFVAVLNEMYWEQDFICPNYENTGEMLQKALDKLGIEYETPALPWYPT